MIKSSCLREAKKGQVSRQYFRDLWKTKDVFCSFSLLQFQSEAILYFFFAAYEIESEIRGLVHNNTAWFSSHDQDHFSSDSGELVPL